MIDSLVLAEKEGSIVIWSRYGVKKQRGVVRSRLQPQTKTKQNKFVKGRRNEMIDGSSKRRILLQFRISEMIQFQAMTVFRLLHSELCRSEIPRNRLSRVTS